MRRLGWALGILLLVTLAAPGRVLAHAQLERADPPIGASVAQAPKELRLVFTEPVDGSFSRVQVLDSKREVVDRGDSRVAPDDPRAMVVSLKDGLPDGIYTVAWRTLSLVDGHTVNGAYPLSVGSVPEGASTAVAVSSEARFAPETAVARWWLYIAASGLFGALLTWTTVFAPLLAGPNAAARTGVERRARWLALVSGGLLLVGTLYAALAQAAAAADVPLWGALGTPLLDVLLRGRYSLVWWPRLGLTLLAVDLVLWRGVHGWTGRVALAAAAGVLLTSSLTSHGAALVSGPYLGIAADWLHFLGVAAWIGGLASLVFVLPPAVRATKGSGEPVLARAVGRFSNLALVSVGVIVATGAFQAWLHVGSWEGLWQTAYGLSITAKVGIMALMLVLGAFNLLVARPRLAQVGAQGEAKRDAAGAAKRDMTRIRGASSGSAAGLAARLAWAVRGELLLGVLVLAVAAILTGLAPARDEMARRAAGTEGQGGPVDRRVDAQGLAARVAISPNSVGRNRFVVELPGTDPASVERVQLTLTYLDAELGSQPLVLERSGAAQGTWEAESTFLSQPGQWQAELLVRRANQDDARTALRFTVAGLGGAAVQTAPAAAYPLLPSPIMSVAYGLAGAGLLVVLVAGARWARSASRRARNAQARLAAAGLMVLLSGGYVYGQEQRMGMPLDVANVRNPVPPDERSLASGKAIYLENCAACHGETGRGDGPAGLRLVPRPADLRVHMAAGHTDGQLFYWVSYGVQGTGMPAWKDQLTEQQRWDTINFIRTFANPNAASGPASGGPPAQPVPATAVPTPTVTPPPGGEAPPGGAWAEVGRWRASDFLVTQPFTTRGPWRIRWRLDSAAESFLVMVLEGDLEPRPLAGAPGATEGVFEEPRGGTFSLMFHNGIPYEVVVEEQRL